jgi:hypothetical protein
MKVRNITRDFCDGCSDGPVRPQVPVITYYHYGAPVLTQCAECAPKEFERQAREDIDNWLKGADLG